MRSIKTCRWFLLTVMIAVLTAFSQAQANNLVGNGGFESGNIGFSSDYTYQFNLYPPSVYYIGANPHDNHTSWGSFTPHQGNSMMIINGAQQQVSVWSESNIAVDLNTTYYFSTWVASSYPDSPAKLDFSINGSLLGSTFTASTTVGLWQQFYATWDSGANTTANLKLINLNTDYDGNDFVLDDIVLDTERPAVPEPATLLLFGGGLVGLAAYRMRSGKA